jgi:predicted HTH domain antitoxin
MITTRNLKMQIPQDIFIALNINENEMIYDLKLNYAIELFRSGKLTIGKAAELAGVKRYSFECMLSERNIPISDITFQEVKDDVESLKLLIA